MIPLITYDCEVDKLKQRRGFCMGELEAIYLTLISRASAPLP